MNFGSEDFSGAEEAVFPTTGFNDWQEARIERRTTVKACMRINGFAFR
ncbi:MAG: hypothetical protein H7Y27_00320 [Gemmatimonadaceae bacterium]|nr:hypothetical protein [Chitinophagaceae bacterium]